jgi:FtsP/CotA-like multicopper oxidase with cupredoxin domain
MPRSAGPSRRRFVQGLLGAATLGFGPPCSGGAERSAPDVLSGTDFALTIDELPLRITGTHRVATAINGQVPAPLLRMRQGDVVTLRVTNRLRVASSSTGTG